MKILTEKTKLMITVKESVHSQLKVKGKMIKQVMSFKYNYHHKQQALILEERYKINIDLTARKGNNINLSIRYYMLHVNNIQ